ncbi:MAG: response regulator transcription factor, partial [Candidatus Rokubacteria bacterium]|nr:response regulator transcription factor [Candidatus Rokubacteria bacterium]
MPLRIVLADDHQIVRQGLKSLLVREGIEAGGEASDGHEALRLVETLRPDVAVLDIAMLLLNGIDTARALPQVSPRTKAILLTMHKEDQYVLDALRAGIKGFVLKTQATSDLVAELDIGAGPAELAASGRLLLLRLHLDVLLQRLDPALDDLDLLEDATHPVELFVRLRLPLGEGVELPAQRDDLLLLGLDVDLRHALRANRTGDRENEERDERHRAAGECGPAHRRDPQRQGRGDEERDARDRGEPAAVRALARRRPSAAPPAASQIPRYGATKAATRTARAGRGRALLRATKATTIGRMVGSIMPPTISDQVTKNPAGSRPMASEAIPRSESASQLAPPTATSAIVTPARCAWLARKSVG